jgi:hypothetical protein
MKSPSRLLCAATTIGLMVAGRPALAQEPAGPPSLPNVNVDEVESEPTTQEDLQKQIEELRVRLREKDEEAVRNADRLSINGYVDFGYFLPIGNKGIGWVRDVGNKQFPAANAYSWTFVGDILSTAVNTRGEPADLGDAPGISRYDSINSDGAQGFLVNELNMRLGYQLSERALLHTSINFTPRSGIQDFSLGDQVDIDLAEVEYVLTADGKTSLFAGKTLPVFGIEYKERKSDQRFGITPSLIDRYTAGPQLGLKFRSKLLKDWIILAGAVSNNSSVIEPFHFYSEVDKNSGKTLSGRGAISVPMGLLASALQGDRLELAMSGLWGSQDRASDNSGKTSFWGFDLQYLGADYSLKAQWMKGKSAGLPSELVWELKLRASGYVEVDWQMFSWLGVMVRGSQRNADVILGMERIYITRSRQLTAGIRFVFNPNAMLKLEYIRNMEYGGVAEFKNDIATSSLVLHF